MDKLIPNTEPTSEIPAANGRTTEFKTYANYLRARIADLGRLVQCFKKHPGIQHADLRFCKVESDRGEMAANVVLSYRHLEDASMRLGKAIQAYDGGVSCYDAKGDKAAVADVGHGQEIPKGPDAIIGDKCIDLKCAQSYRNQQEGPAVGVGSQHGLLFRDLSGNQLTMGSIAWLQDLSRALSYELILREANEGKSTFHLHMIPSGLKVGSFGELKSVFSFLADKVKTITQIPVAHADAISWPAGESSARPFVQPPQPFATVGTFEEAEKARNDKFRADVACRAYAPKPFTDESHSA